MKSWVLKRNGVILSWCKFQSCNNGSWYTIVQEVYEPAFVDEQEALYMKCVNLVYRGLDK